MTPPCFCLTARRFSARWRWARRILRGKIAATDAWDKTMKNALGLITLIIAIEAVASEAALKPPLPMRLSARAENKGQTERADRIPALPEGSLVPLAPPERLSGVPGKTSGARTDEGEPISLEFHHAELTAVLQAFADFTGLNII